MTKIPVDYAYEETWKVSKNKEDKKMERRRIMSDKLLTIAAALVVAITLGLFALCVSMYDGAVYSESAKVAAKNAQCKSIGGVFDGEACWYNGEKIDVNKYVEEWK